MNAVAATAVSVIPAEIVGDRLLKVDVRLSDDCRGCGYQGHEFGAPYPDSTCIDGFLWDADSGHADPAGEGWIYTNGGDRPCPYCNHTAWVEGALEELEDEGFDAQARGVPRAKCGFPEKARFAHLGEAFRDAWLRGWDEAAKDP